MSGIGFTRGMTGRADLIRARRMGDPELEEYLAGLLGYRLVADEPRPPDGSGVTIVDPEPPTPREPTSHSVTHDMPFWQASHFEVFPVRSSSDVRAIKARAARRKAKKPTTKRERKPVDLSFSPLSSNPDLLTRLRAASPTQAISGEIDIDRVVEEWGRGRYVAKIPRSLRKSWGRSVQVFVDRSRRLIPYWEDQTRACLAIREVYPPEGFSVVVLPEGRFEPSSMKFGGQTVDYQPPPPGSAVVALSDLGALAPGGSGLVDFWAERGRRLRDLEVKPLAVAPYHRAACPKELSRYWSVLPWETGADAPALSDKEAEALVRQILTLLSFTLRIEPQVIRFVRRLLPGGRGEPAIESRVWQHEAFGDPHCEAAELSKDQASSLRTTLLRQESELRRQIYERIEASHRRIYDGIWYAEMRNLGGDELIDDDQRREMCAWFKSQAKMLESKTRPDELGALAAWHGEVSERLLNVAYQDRDGLGTILHQIWSIVHRDDPNAVLPDGADLSLLPRETERRIELRQFGDRLIAGEELRYGTPLALLRTFQSRLKIEPFDDFWEGGAAPAWADGWGRDDFGPWVDLRVEGAEQRLRWIRPGKFWMGSPQDEEGRYPDEGPRHEETMASGFWMFDTPCTQALWEAVMGENPSEFNGPDRPVESVSWDQCQEFLKRLNERLEGLELKLPSEAQWEYSCRAATDTPRYRQDLNEIAWYGENSQGETHPVGQKAPNDWGFYDTLGNVLEWCEDVWTDDYSTKKKAGASARRVVRGGSWVDVAQVLRAAYRLRNVPSYRVDDLGFRCAAFRAPGPVGREQDRERAGERGDVGAEHPGDRDTASGVGWINLDAPGMDGVSFAALAPLRVSSDVEQVVLRTTTRPKWASAIGRDKYGLWAEFTIEGKVAKPPTKRAASKKKKSAPREAPLGPVRQRLRWIPPGRFRMGSPPDEEGRYPWQQDPHGVTIGEGFWMFGTPCAQALWEALMGENPSHFSGADRPVESVSWEQCQEFLRALNSRLDGLRLSLPSEAQWEYACRAGTETARYSENLDAIAWYDKNSGNETHPVANKEANSWGLYDMLGNVWEWCADVWVDDDTEGSRAAALADSASAPRVVRGGSWFDDARDVRAAYRVRDVPSDRGDVLGFRCAEFRQVVVSGARPGSEAEGAEQPGDRDPTSAATRPGKDGD